HVGVNPAHLKLSWLVKQLTNSGWSCLLLSSRPAAVKTNRWFLFIAPKFQRSWSKAISSAMSGAHYRPVKDRVGRFRRGGRWSEVGAIVSTDDFSSRKKYLVVAHNLLISSPL